MAFWLSYIVINDSQTVTQFSGAYFIIGKHIHIKNHTYGIIIN